MMNFLLKILVKLFEILIYKLVAPITTSVPILNLMRKFWAISDSFTTFLLEKELMVFTPAVKIALTKYMTSSFVGFVMLGISALTTAAVLSSPVWVFNLDGLTLYEHLEFLKNKFFNFFFNIPFSNSSNITGVHPKITQVPIVELDISKDLENSDGKILKNSSSK